MQLHASVQLEVQDRVGKMADLDEQLAEMHKRLEKQLLQQLDTQELLRCTAPLMLFTLGSPQSSQDQQCDHGRALTSSTLTVTELCNLLQAVSAGL